MATQDDVRSDLAARCEAATGPDDALDFQIAEAVGCAPGLPYTESIDAAMTLVPEEWTAWGIWSRRCKTQFYAILSRLRDDFDKDELDEEEDVRSKRCASPALALCAAALRSRAHLPTTEDDNG